MAEYNVTKNYFKNDFFLYTYVIFQFAEKLNDSVEYVFQFPNKITVVHHILVVLSFIEIHL